MRRGLQLKYPLRFTTVYLNIFKVICKQVCPDFILGTSETFWDTRKLKSWPLLFWCLSDFRGWL